MDYAKPFWFLIQEQQNDKRHQVLPAGFSVHLMPNILLVIVEDEKLNHFWYYGSKRYNVIAVLLVFGREILQEWLLPATQVAIEQGTQLPH